jgi:2-methylisocitrate lyase-like PEP mutase family enzyme
MASPTDNRGTTPNALAAAAERFRALHHAAETLVLPNAWDAASAAALVEAGFEAIATSSGAVSRSLGYSDGEGTPVEEAFAAVARIVRAATHANAQALVTADIEHGYDLPAAELTARLLQTGAVGYNLEDSRPHSGEMIPVEEQAERIAALRRAGLDAGVPLVLNARVDLHVRQHGPEGTRLERSIERAKAYLAAGADCVFPIMLTAEADVGTYATSVPGPVNIMAVRAAPSLRRLRELGVGRVTFGSGMHRVALAALTAAAERVLAGNEPWAE